MRMQRAAMGSNRASSKAGNRHNSRGSNKGADNSKDNKDRNRRGVSSKVLRTVNKADSNKVVSSRVASNLVARKTAVLRSVQDSVAAPIVLARWEMGGATAGNFLPRFASG